MKRIRIRNTGQKDEIHSVLKKTNDKREISWEAKETKQDISRLECFYSETEKVEFLIYMLIMFF